MSWLKKGLSNPLEAAVAHLDDKSVTGTGSMFKDLAIAQKTHGNDYDALSFLGLQWRLVAFQADFSPDHTSSERTLPLYSTMYYYNGQIA